MRRALVLSLVAALALCACGSLDAPDRVHDLRLLAMRADPPEQVFALPLPLDAGALVGPDGGLDPGTAAALAGLQLQPVTVTALVADPRGAGRSIHYDFAYCSALVNNRCDLADPHAFVVGAGDAVADGGYLELSVTFAPKLAVLAAAVQADPYHGFGFLPLPVQLSLTSGGEEVVGFKRVLFTVVFQGEPVPAPNQNPYIPALLLDGHLWSASGPVAIADREGHTVSPVPVPDAEERYQRPQFQGGALTFRESWRYNFFATAGGFSPFGSGGQSNLTGAAAPTDSTWSPRKEDGAGRVTFFVVVRDGRGGEGWAVRSADFAPP